MHGLTVNYLHYGGALDGGQLLSSFPDRGLCAKKDLVQGLARGNGASGALEVLVRGYGAKQSKKIDVEHFHLDIARSRLLHRPFFTSLGCRGFSYKLDSEIELNEPLESYVTLRVALMPDELLFYPPRVKRYLRRVNGNHYFCDGYPSIAFALGMKTKEAWFIFVMQSDLALRGPSYIRDHFRGWRKVLFTSILRLAVGQTKNVYLCRVEDVVRALHSDFPVRSAAPAAWNTIYAGTADFFSMEPTRLREPIGIQVFQEQAQITTDQCYALSITPSLEARVRALYGEGEG